MDLDIEKINNFQDAFMHVFTADDKVANCGRTACIMLIKASNEIEPGDYGDVNTGFMNAAEILALRDKLSHKI